MMLHTFITKRPVSAKLLVLSFFILGILLISKVPKTVFFKPAENQLLLTACLEKAPAKDIDIQITRRIEKGLRGLSCLEEVLSLSRKGLSLIWLKFEPGTNMPISMLEIQDKLDWIVQDFPLGVKGPYIEVTKMGLLPAHLLNNKEKEIEVQVASAELFSRGITINDVVESIKLSNVNYPVGTLKGKDYEWVLRAVHQLESVEDLKNVILLGNTAAESDPSYLKEVAQILPPHIRDVPFQSDGPILNGINIIVQGNDRKKITSILKKIENRLKKINSLEWCKAHALHVKPEKLIDIDPERSALLGGSAKDVALTAEAAVAGIPATTIFLDGEPVTVRVRLNQKEASDSAVLNRLIIRRAGNRNILLGDCALIKDSWGINQIVRLNGQEIVWLECRPKRNRKKKMLSELRRELGKIENLSGISVYLRK